MKLKFLFMALAFATATQAATLDSVTLQVPDLKPLPQQPRAAHLAAEILNHFHYKPVALDHALSEKIFDHYVKSLDGDRIFFMQADIDQWGEARTRLDDAIVGEDLAIPFSMFNLYTRRVVQRFTYARSLLKAGFDFRQNESYQYRRDKEPWAKSEQELHDLWRLRVKDDWLKLKLAGKDDKNIAETLDKRYDGFLRRTERVKSDDAFQVFMNAYTMAIDPHTNYMGPRAAEDFDISMRLSLVGIGAVLEEKDEYTTIKELVAGGPAALSGKLKAGDRILGVAQGEKGLMTDIVGWRIDDAVALIRGAADSVVQLDILPADAGPDGKPKRISLVRKKISLEEQAAKKSIVTLSEAGAPHRIGVIALPTFYQDFEARQRGDHDFRSATRDVSRLLGELKKDKVDGVLIDLRDNGGGSLAEAIELTGLFIDTGPVVQQRDAKGKVTVSSDTNAGVAWDGPLGVVINRASASASEIFAAAVQDYRRGLVIGEPSFGKGTVQTLIDLDRFGKGSATDKPKFGELKLTIAQFFRINGGTTQLRGVTPDIGLPALSDPEHFGEASYDNALPWMRIQAADYTAVDDLNDLLPALLKRHQARVAKDKDYLHLEEDIAERNALRKKNLISLNEAERRKERNAQEARMKQLRAKEAVKDKNASATTPDKKSAAEIASGQDDDDADAGAARKNANRLLLDEAAHILDDETELMKGRSSFAARTSATPQAATTK